MNKLIKTLIVAIGLTLVASSARASMPGLSGAAVSVTGATPAVNFSGKTQAIVVLNAASVTPAYSNIGAAGATFTILFQQDGTGGRLLVQPTTAPTVVMPGGTAAVPGTLPAMPSAANAFTYWVVQSNGTNLVLQGAYDNTFPGIDSCSGQGTVGTVNTGCCTATTNVVIAVDSAASSPAADPAANCAAGGVLTLSGTAAHVHNWVRVQ